MLLQQKTLTKGLNEERIYADSQIKNLLYLHGWKKQELEAAGLITYSHETERGKKAFVWFQHLL